MRKLVFCFLMFTISASAQNSRLKELSEKIFNQMRNREFVTVNSSFDPVMAAKVDTVRLRKTWDNLLFTAGKFIRVNDVSIEEQQNFHVVIQHCEFENKKVDFKLVFDSNEVVRGLFFIPADQKEFYKPPAYCKSQLKEKNVLIPFGDKTLPGILTTPDKAGKFPVVILIHGSGPNDKDETVGPTKIFKDLSCGLGQKNIAVLRFDKRTRGILGKRTKPATVQQEVIDDVISAIAVAKTDSFIDAERIYLCGHSMGGMLLPRICSQVPDIKGLIYINANANKLEDMILEQAEYIISLDTLKDRSQLLDSVRKETAKIKALTGNSSEDSLKIFQQPASYWLDLNKYDAMKMASGCPAPMLFLQGGRDYQVREKEFNLWKSALKGKQATFRLYPELNHFMISGKGLSVPGEYGRAGNVEDTVINDIAGWINATK
jgi:uncharacterized protein